MQRLSNGSGPCPQLALLPRAARFPPRAVPELQLPQLGTPWVGARDTASPIRYPPLAAPAWPLQAIGAGGGSGDPPEYQGSEHGDGIRRRAEEVPGHLSGGVEAGDGLAALAQHLRLGVGGDAAEGVGDGADQRIGEV